MARREGVTLEDLEEPDAEEQDGDEKYHFNGSAKVALLGIAESRAAWEVLMEAGKAAAIVLPPTSTRTARGAS